MPFDFNELQIPFEMAAKNIKLKDLKPFVLILLQECTKSGHFLCRRGGRFPFRECPASGPSESTTKDNMLVHTCQLKYVGVIYPFHGYSNSCGKVGRQRLLTQGRRGAEKRRGR